MRHELGVTDDEVVLSTSSNLRPVKRIDLLLEAAARIGRRRAFKLVILAGEDFAPFGPDVHRLGLEGRVIVREHVTDIEDYLQAADLGLFTSDSESFCLSILEAMCFGCPSVATRVGGIPEVVEDGVTGVLVPAGDSTALVRALEALIADPVRRTSLGRGRAQERKPSFQPRQSCRNMRNSIGVCVASQVSGLLCRRFRGIWPFVLVCYPAGIMDIGFIDRSALLAEQTRTLAFALASHLRLVGLLILCFSCVSCNNGISSSARQMDFDIRRIDRDRD